MDIISVSEFEFASGRFLARCQPYGQAYTYEQQVLGSPSIPKVYFLGVNYLLTIVAQIVERCFTGMKINSEAG